MKIYKLIDVVRPEKIAELQYEHGAIQTIGDKMLVKEWLTKQTEAEIDISNFYDMEEEIMLKDFQSENYLVTVSGLAIYVYKLNGLGKDIVEIQ